MGSARATVRQVTTVADSDDGFTGASRNDDRSDEKLILAAVMGVLDELHIQLDRPVFLDSNLTNDLGVDSLALVELFDQIERASGVTLPDHVFLHATTPRDWLEALRAARGEATTVDTTSPVDSTSTSDWTLQRPAGEMWPRDARTITEALEWHVRTHPDLVCIRVLDAPGGSLDLTYRALADGSHRVAFGLLNDGLERGARVAIMLPTGEEFFITFLGALLAGAVPVPIYPPAQMAVLEEHLTRQSRLLENAGAVCLVTVPEAVVAARLVRTRVATLRSVRTVPALVAAGAQPLPLPEVDENDLALIQYTSGSTGDPKGVVLTNAQLIANIWSMGTTVRVDSADLLVSWLPLYHDMGLIGCWLTPLLYGFPLVIMSPLAFLAHPMTWLRTMSTYRATLSVGPNFAYQSCVQRGTDADLESLDLSRWRVAINGSEPVSNVTVERFIERFAPCGFRRSTMCPAYGLAEMGVGVAFTPLDAGPIVDVIDRATLQGSGVAEPAVPGSSTITIVSCGRTLTGYDVRVLGVNGAELTERHEGTVQCQGPSATIGYFNNEAATRALWRDGWLDTGDLGYVANGNLFLTGRSKDLIIRAGRKLHPEDLEQDLGEIDDVITGAVAVFARPDPSGGTEQIVVVVETDLTSDESRRALRQNITRRSVELLGVAPDEVVLTTRSALLRTASGKIRRSAVRDALTSRRLGRRAPPPIIQLARFWWRGLGATVRRLPNHAHEWVFSLYAWSLVALSAGAAGLLAVAPLSRRRQFTSARRLGRTLASALRITIEIDGDLASVPPAIVVANHSSLLDGLVLFLYGDESTAFVTSTELGRRNYIGWLLRRFGCVFIERGRPDRSGTAVAQLTDAVTQRRRLVIFPEGSLSRATGLRPFHLGAFEAAAATGAPLVPVGISGSRAILAPGSWRVRSGHVKIRVGPAHAPSGSNFAARVDLRDALRDEVERLIDDVVEPS